ncbi:MAG: tetratricopeptide repeat protein [Pseudomonadota bacterium]|nr:tetratricopeptide repeat protein [Pseudomonadota bacterium]
MAAVPTKNNQLNVQISQAKKLHRDGKLEPARKIYEKLLRKHPGHITLLALMGGVCLQTQQYQEAISYLKHACAKNKTDADLPYNLALAYYHLRDYESAVIWYQQAIEMNPEHDRAFYMMGKAYMEWNGEKYKEEAFNAYRRDVELTERVDSYVMLAEIMFSLKRYEDARGLAKRALEQDPKNEIALWTMAKTMIKENYKKAYMDVRHAEPIIKAGSLILKLYPKSWRGHHVLAEGLSMIGEDELAIQHYEKLNKLQPGFAGSKTSAAVLKLRQGKLQEGWEEISHRKSHGTDLFGINVVDIEKCPAPAWQGELESGKKILVASEQGIGDQMLHAQMLRELIDAGMEVHMTCTPKIVDMMARSLPQAHFYPANEGVPQEIRDQMDYKAELLDLGKFLRSDLDKFKQPFYYLQPEPGLLAEFQEKYKQFGNKLKIGISWKSSSKSVGDLKSTQLVQWKDILAIPEAQFISVQYGEIQQDLEQLKEEAGLELFVDDFDPYADVEKAVAQIAALDMVVSVSNAAVHFSGQLNIPTWVLLNQRTLWHWFDSGENTVWYDALRLYRQEQLESWDPVFERVASDLKQLVAGFNEQISGEES